ncbi:MAG: SBBP repeat-containing protein [Nitrospirae bacterium]|nr:SBBP repeat-containing protein [Nitrospirota bacterium]
MNYKIWNIAAPASAITIDSEGNIYVTGSNGTIYPLAAQS